MNSIYRITSKKDPSKTYTISTNELANERTEYDSYDRKKQRIYFSIRPANLEGAENSDHFNSLLNRLRYPLDEFTYEKIQ